MTHQELMDFATRHGLVANSAKSVAGKWKEYVVLITLENKNTVSASFAVEPKAQDKERGKKVKDLKGALKAQKVALFRELNGTIGWFIGKKELTLHTLDYYLDVITDGMKTVNIQPATVCPVCGGVDCEVAGFYNGDFTPIHESCLRGAMGNMKREIQAKGDSSSYVTGMAGAIIGMLLGVAVNILVAVITDSIYAILFALIPAASFWMYKKFNGKTDKFSTIMTIVLTVISVYVFMIFTTAYFIADETPMIGYGYALALTAEYVLSGEGFLAATLDCLQYFLFAGLGLVISWRYITLTDGKIINGTDTAVNTMVRIK